MTWRDLMCGEVRPEHVGKRLTLSGWADGRRDHGGLVFVDLRDRTGICQLVVNPERAPEAVAAAHAVRNEFVLRAEGEVVRRAPENVNPNLPTGEVELQVDQLEIVSRAPPLPFQLDEENVDETLRLRYRWLDLRRPRMQRNIALRAQMVGTIRRVMEEAGFLDIQTPILFKPTPEGARDFIVPSRLQPGRFFALPQSPQILKQLLVIGGFDRYYQIAICFRDEDLRADRVQEITQLDVEMAFPDQEFLFALMERMCRRGLARVHRRRARDAVPAHDARRGAGALRQRQAGPPLRARDRGRDRGDARLRVRRLRGTRRPSASCACRRRSRAASSQRLEEVAKEWGAKGLAYLVYDEDGEVRSPIAKFLSEDELELFRGEPGSTVLFGADEPAIAARVLGALRLHLGRELGLDRRGRVALRSGSPTSRCSSGTRTRRAGRPSTTRSRGRRPARRSSSRATRARRRRSPTTWSSTGSRSAAARSGSTSRSSRRSVFDALQLSAEEQRAKFGFLLDALAMGAPPHGGIAFGIERMLMALGREPNLRDVIAFPKNQAGVDPMSGAPSEVEEEQLRELGIQLRAKPD